MPEPSPSDNVVHLVSEHKTENQQEISSKGIQLSSKSTSDPSTTIINEEPERLSDEKVSHEIIDDGVEYPSKWRLILINIAVCICAFCAGLDNTIISTAIPKIVEQFDSLQDVGWYGSSYLLTTCGATLIYGKLFTYYSLKKVYIAALAIFEMGSLVCATSPNSAALSIGRAVAGLGAGGLFSGSILICSRCVPLRQRPMYTGILGGVFGISGVAGPLLGGILTDRVSWRWCFYINLPIGAMTAICLFFFYKQHPLKKDGMNLTNMEKLKALDLQSMLLFIPAIVCLLLALQWGGTKYHWQNAQIITLFVLFGILSLGWVFLQHKKKDLASVPPRLIKNRNVWASALISVTLTGAFNLTSYYLPLWFQHVKGVSALESGIMILPLILAMVIALPLTGSAVTLVGYYTPFMIASTIILTVGIGLLTRLSLHSGPAEWIGYQTIAGIGAGMGIQQPIIAIQAALPPGDIPLATGVIMFLQNLGGALAISIGQAVFLKRLVIDIPGTTTIDGTAIQYPSSADPVGLEGYSTAITQTILVAVALGSISCMASLFVEWLSMKRKK